MTGTLHDFAIFFVLIVQIITFGLLVVPVLRITGIGMHWWIPVLWLLAPTVLVAQRVAKPMAYGKSIGQAFSSWVRYQLDDTTHRRGVPIAPRRHAPDEVVVHYQREWVMYPEYAAEEAAERDVTDPITESRLRRDDATSMSGFMDEHTRIRAQQAAELRAERNTFDAEEIYSRRAVNSTVVDPDDYTPPNDRETV